MTTQNDLLTELRSYWEFASVCQFLHLFSKGLRVEGFETEDLENQLISDTLTHNLAVLHISLLKALFGPPNSRLITYESWQQYLVREYTKRELECELSGPDAEYGNLPLRERVLILYHLCEWQLDNTDRFRAAVGDEDEGEWRVEPVGTDTKGNTYWLFDDNRLYRESPAAAPAKGGNKKKGRRQSGKQESGWVLECATIEDWEAFPDRFARSRSLLEKDFCQFLRDEIIPKVIPDLQAKEKVKKVEEAMSNRKRSSRLQMRELEQEEQKRQQQLAQERRELQRQERAEADKRTKEEMERIRRIEAREQRIAERESRLRKIPRVSDGPMPTLDEVAAAQSAELKSRASSRQKRRKKEEEEEDEDRWYFDCICGVHGENLDDGAPMIACGRCNVWQHIACLARANGDTGNVDIKKWEELDFVCKNCEERKASLSNSSSDESTPVTEDVMTTTSHLSALGTPNGFADLLPQTASHLPQFNGTPITHQQPHAAGPHSQNGTSTPQSYIPPTHVVPLNHSTATTLPLIPDTAFHPVSITAGLPAITQQGAALGLPHPAAPAYYQSYAAGGVLGMNGGGISQPLDERGQKEVERMGERKGVVGGGIGLGDVGALGSPPNPAGPPGIGARPPASVVPAAQPAQQQQTVESLQPTPRQPIQSAQPGPSVPTQPQQHQQQQTEIPPPPNLTTTFTPPQWSGIPPPVSQPISVLPGGGPAPVSQLKEQAPQMFSVLPGGVAAAHEVVVGSAGAHLVQAGEGAGVEGN